jgi:CRP/FNR family transcriptional regulator, polysaccharide utilization system transcription regulator
MKKVQNENIDRNIEISNYTIFSPLSSQEVQSLNADVETHYFPRGEILYEENHRINGCYFVEKGIVKIFKTGIDGKEQIIRFAKAGDLIGFRSVINTELACTTAKIIDDAQLLYIHGPHLMDLLKKNPEFSMALMKMACKELGESNKYITDIAQKTVRERLAEVLLLLMDSFDLDKDNFLNISLTREELANMVGTATESVIRLLSEFKTDKLIELHGRRIRLVNIPKLIKIGNVYD